MATNPWLDAMGIPQWTLRNAPTSSAAPAAGIEVTEKTVTPAQPVTELAAPAETQTASNTPAITAETPAAIQAAPPAPSQTALEALIDSLNGDKLLVLWEGPSRPEISTQEQWPQSNHADLIRNILGAIGVSADNVAVYSIANADAVLAELASATIAGNLNSNILLFGNANTEANTVQRNGKHVISGVDLASMVTERSKKGALWMQLKPLKEAGVFSA